MVAKYIVVVGYALLIVVVGILGMRKTRNFNDFLLGGGKVGPWMTAFSYGTAYFSAVLFIGFAGKIGWGFGLSGIWIAVGNTVLGVFGVWFLLGSRIKKAAVDYNIHTMPEFLEARYNSPFFKFFTSAAIFVFFIPYTAAVFMGLSYLFEVSFGLPYTYVLLFMGVFTGIYLVLGGYKSMAMIDVVFGMIMTIGVIILLTFTLNKGGGVGKHHTEPQGNQSKVGCPGWTTGNLAAAFSDHPDKSCALRDASTGPEILCYQGQEICSHRHDSIHRICPSRYGYSIFHRGPHKAVPVARE